MGLNLDVPEKNMVVGGARRDRVAGSRYHETGAPRSATSATWRFRCRDAQLFRPNIARPSPASRIDRRRAIVE